METLDLASQTCTVHTHLFALALSLLFFLEASDGGFSDLHLSAPSLLVTLWRQLQDCTQSIYKYGVYISDKRYLYYASSSNNNSLISKSFRPFSKI